VADIQILEAIGIDYIDESEVLTPADEVHHITKHNYKVPFVCGCRNLGEALRRIAVSHLLQKTISNVSGRSSIDTYKGRSRNR
jgi:pyridoxal 5'-phosphate synthase pdxS subunit